MEATLNNQEIAFAALFDMERASSNSTLESLIQAIKSHGVKNTICNWVKTMLHGREVEAEV